MDDLPKDGAATSAPSGPLDEGLIDAAEAAARLKVRRATLYAYVSRGLIRSVVMPDDPRAHLYPAVDIAALARRKVRMRRPAAAAATALDWGLPVLESRIAHIEGGRLFYRGTDAVVLAETRTFESTCRHLWGAGRANPFAGSGFDADAVPDWQRLARSMTGWTATDRTMALLPLTLADEQPADASAELRHAARLVLALATAAAGGKLPIGQPLHRALARLWRRPAAADAIRRALVLCADHELNVSTFAVRVVASSGASLTAALLAGLGALSGPRHGGMVLRALDLMRAIDRAGDAEAVIRARLKRGETLPGFGHPLYPDGDPRATALLPHIGRAPLARDTLASVQRLTGLYPNIDFVLAGIEIGRDLPPGSAMGLFAIGRAAGWVAHALEQRMSRGLIRPRARFVADPVSGDAP